MIQAKIKWEESDRENNIGLEFYIENYIYMMICTTPNPLGAPNWVPADLLRWQGSGQNRVLCLGWKMRTQRRRTLKFGQNLIATIFEFDVYGVQSAFMGVRLKQKQSAQHFLASKNTPKIIDAAAE